MMRQLLDIVLFLMTSLICVSYSVNPGHECIAFESAYHIERACECVTYSSDGRSQGTFTSPNYPQFYPNNINCILYTFLGDLEEIVEISFFEFDLQVPITNKCTDFVRFFLDLPRPEVNERDVWNYELCGNISMIQKVHYSSERPLILEFHTDNIQGNHTGFRGSFKFLNTVQFEIQGGSRRWATQCTYDFYSNRNTKAGQFFSPGYPQHYPADGDCKYVFYGGKKERVKVTFQNIQLEQIDGSCTDSPDHIIVRDGQDNTAPVIAQYCNTYNGIEVISSGESLFIEFDVDEKKQKQGFAATFEFVLEADLRPVTPSFPPDPYDHCAYQFNSEDGKHGKFSSPQYPAPYSPNMRCKYVFQGSGKERVQIKFWDIDLNHQQVTSHSKKCDEEHSDAVIVTVVIDNQRRVISRFCSGSPYHQLMSAGTRLEVDFISHGSASNSKGFNATYKFVTDFGIKTGEQNNDAVCGFKYRSGAHPNGTFTSPNYPGIYPRNTECSYEFFGEESESVYITFQFFDVEGMPPKCDQDSRSDYVEFSNFNIPDRKMNRFCGEKEKSIKKEVQSDGRFFRVVFKSNDVYDAHGFQAVFQFRGKDGNADNTVPIPKPQGNVARTNAMSAIMWTLIVFTTILAS